MRSVHSVRDGESVEFKEDVIIEGSVGKGAKIIVIEADLNIKGSVESGAQITIKKIPQQISLAPGGPMIVTHHAGSVTYIEGHVANDKVQIIDIIPRNISVAGDIGENVTITGAHHITITGRIARDATVETTSGNIVAGDIGENAKLSTNNGNIQCGHVAQGAIVKNISGQIQCGNIAQGAFVQNINGAIHCGHIAAGASVQSTHGRIVAAKAHDQAKLVSKRVIVTKQYIPGTTNSIHIGQINVTGPHAVGVLVGDQYNYAPNLFSPSRAPNQVVEQETPAKVIIGKQVASGQLFFGSQTSPNNKENSKEQLLPTERTPSDDSKFCAGKCVIL